MSNQSKFNSVFLSSDAMVNLDRNNLDFTGLGNGNYAAQLSDDDLNNFLSINDLFINDLGELEDKSEQCRGETWGAVAATQTFKS